MSQESRVAVFVDAENLTQWIKQGGLETLLEDLSSMGSVVVRKAYARWTSANMAVHQMTLNRHGFELIHTFHPVSGRNSADIQITVDVMEYAWRDDLTFIALATGDSDFSPLFRRLREMGKQVVGVGPRSALSESVKSSCSRFFYTQTETASPVQDEASRASAFDDAADLLEAALKKFDGPANCSALKTRMLNIDSAFDEKALGFKSFTAFVKAVDGIELVQDGKTWSAIFQESEASPGMAPKKTSKATSGPGDIDPAEHYRRILRKKHWRSIPTSVLTRCYAKIQDAGGLPKSELLEKVVALCEGDVTTADVKKSTELLFKAHLVTVPGTNHEGESLWQVTYVPEAEMLHTVDGAMLVRLIAGLRETHGQLDRKHVAPLLVGKYSEPELDELLEESSRSANRDGESQD
jgi:uncharacterized protein (TIGR00288 family)